MKTSRERKKYALPSFESIKLKDFHESSVGRGTSTECLVEKQGKKEIRRSDMNKTSRRLQHDDDSFDVKISCGGGRWIRGQKKNERNGNAAVDRGWSSYCFNRTHPCLPVRIETKRKRWVGKNLIFSSADSPPPSPLRTVVYFFPSLHPRRGLFRRLTTEQHPFFTQRPPQSPFGNLR